MLTNGLKHGTVTVLSQAPLEITTFRTEGGYHDHRHPDWVRFVPDLTQDLARRDFTINAMAYSAEEGLCDPFGGQEDLARGVVRAVGEPLRRFEEDALRILRLYRFAARFGFVIDEATEAAGRPPRLRVGGAHRRRAEQASVCPEAGGVSGAGSAGLRPAGTAARRSVGSP